ncbi:TetR/AcrR family transcriptional regulator [Moheibacter stercoris]|uniref:AcrR family transcriptional regulator n=1 Tax=Moheibacter stercoris TaxID=1628251 RepID=A0ABV2LWX9_9FLAO
MNLTERQLEIIKASGKILMESGIAGLTTKNLAREMNFSESALYRHFKNKETIITLLIAYLAENITQRFDAIINAKQSPEEKFKALFISQFSYFKQNPCFINIVLSDGLIDNSEEVKNAIQQLLHTNFIRFNHLIKEGQKLGVFSTIITCEELVHIVMGTFRLQMLKWKLASFEFDIEVQGQKTMNSLLALIKV